MQVRPCPDGGDAPDASDVKTLVGMFLGAAHRKLLEIPLLHPRFSWTENVLEGLLNYAAFWVRALQQDIVKGSPEPLEKFKECLELLMEDLKGGHAKKCKEWREIGYQAKAREDVAVLQQFPSIPDVVQPAVAKAYRVLRAICRQYLSYSGDLPPKVRALANCIIVGCWHYDTFLGRKWEIEHCLFETVSKAIKEGREYVTCRQHKTHRTYGDVIKYLTPGLRVALSYYKLLPRPDDCEYFLVPVRRTAETISAPTCLKAFNKHFLSSAKVSPCTNHIRKLFHNELMRVTKTEDAVKDFMTILDAHGRSVQDKHYLIRTPEDDLACAKALVGKVLGSSVSWPASSEERCKEELEMLDCCLSNVALDEEPGSAQQLCVDEFDVDDEPDEHWEFGSMFGVTPFGQLNVIAIDDLK